MTDGNMGSRPASQSVPTELVARLEVAEAGSRELDQAVACLFPETLLIREVEQCSDFRPSRTGVVMYCREGQAGYSTSAADVQYFTTSLDAALALAERVLPGWFVGMQRNRFSPDNEAWSIWLEQPDLPEQVECHAATPALAMCIAILKASTASGVGIFAPCENETQTKAPGHE